MPDRGDDRGRGSTRTLVAGILAGTEWRPAENPQEATATAREARDLAVRLRPVLSKLAQQPRGGRRRDLEWLPAVEQLAVDAQYFASWWLPRLEGKSSQTWPSWSADGYADWVKRLDAQRVRTLEMVQGPVAEARVASVTPLRRKNKGAAAAEKAAEAAEVGGAAAVGEAEGERDAPAPIGSESAEVGELTSGGETGASVHDLLGPAAVGETASDAVREDSTAVVRDLPPPPPPPIEPAPASEPSAEIRNLSTTASRHGSPTETLIVRATSRGGAHASRGTLDLTGTPLRPPAREEAEPPHSDPDLPPPIFSPIPPSKPKDVARIIRYSLAAVLFVAGCVLVALAVNQKPKDSANAGQPTSPTSSAQPPVSSTSQSSVGGGPVSAPTTSDSPAPSSSTSTSPSAQASTTASKPSSATSTRSASAPPVSQPTSQPASDTVVSSLTVASLAPDQTGSYTFVAHVTVRTTGTGPVTITLTFAGSSGLGTPGSVGAQSFPVTLSGKTFYDVTKSVDAHDMCPAPYLGVNASAAGASPAYGDTTSAC